MHIFLIDYDNVYEEGFEGIDRLSNGDEVIVLYNRDSIIGINLVLKLQSKNVKLKWFELDSTDEPSRKEQFIVSIGYAISEMKRDDEMYIVCKDGDYDHAIAYAKSNFKTNVSKASSIQGILNGDHKGTKQTKPTDGSSATKAKEPKEDTTKAKEPKEDTKKVPTTV